MIDCPWFHIEFAREHDGEPDYICGHWASEEDALDDLRDVIKDEMSDLRAYPPIIPTDDEVDDFYHVLRAYQSETPITVL